MTRALALAVLALGCQGTSGGALPDARDIDAAVDPCAGPSEWALRPERAIATHADPLGGLAADDSHAYWTEGGGGVRRAPLAGGDAEPLFDGQMAADPGSIALAGGFLFVSIGADLWRMQTDGSAPEVVGAAAPDLASDGDAIYVWQGNQLVRLAADTLELTPVGDAEAPGPALQLVAGAAWWLAPQTAAIWRMPLDLGVAELASAIDGVTGDALAVDGDRAFVAVSADPSGLGQLQRVYLADGLVDPIADLDGDAGIAVDAGSVYWLEPAAARLSRMAVDGGCVEVREQDGGITRMAVAADGLVVAGAGSIALVER